MRSHSLAFAECTVAPVAMEDSDHEVQSSSDERDSCPASPHGDEDQVPEDSRLCRSSVHPHPPAGPKWPDSLSKELSID